MKVIAIIPARGNSKRLHKKNIYPIWGKPMLYWAVQACKNSKYKIDAYVSSEDPEILEVAQQCGAKIHERDPKLADDITYKQEVIRAALDDISTHTFPDIVISLQPNSPEIKSEHLDAAIDKLLQYNKSEIFSVDSNLLQNAAFRVMRYDYAYQKDLSTNCGVIVCDIIDVHTKEDVEKLEQLYGGIHAC